MSITTLAAVQNVRLDDTAAGPDVARMTVIGKTSDAISLRVTVGGFYHDTVMTKGGDFTLLAFREHGFTTTVGAPKLPAIHEFIEIPAGSEVEVFMTGGAYRDYPLKDFGILKQIAPVQESLPKIAGAWENAVFRMDEALYAQSAFYPASPFSTGEPGYMRNHRVLSLAAYPILYNPALRTIRCYTEMTFDVVIHRTGPAVTDQRLISPIFERDLENLILNYTKPGNDGKILNNPIGYLVICPTALVPNITPFTDWRTRKGFKVTIADQTDITSWTATGIAAYIADAYNTWAEPPTGVLLVGDTNYITPFTGSSSYEVTDLYFSTVTSPDVFPDVYVARMPARNATDVDAMVNKFLDYEQNENLGTGWYDQACFLAPPDAGAQGEITHNACIADYFQPAGLTCYTIYSSQGGNTTDIINNLNAGRTACLYSGHGSTTGWAEPAFSISYIDSSLTNAGMYPFVGSFACITAQFDVTECYGEAWVKRPNKGAIAFWGSSPSSYWDEDDILERRLWEAYFDDSQWSFGEMCVDALVDLWDYYSGGGQSLYYMEAYTIFGDPLMDMWSATPETMTVNFPGVIPIGPSNVTVTVHAGADPVEYALVCIRQGTNFHSAAYTDASGTALVPVNPLTPDTCDITITGHNMDPFESTIQPSASGPYVMYISHTLDDSAGNNDGNANPGETINLDITVQNYGSDPAYGVSGTLASTDPHVLITDGTAGFGDIVPDATALNADALTIDVLSTCPDGHVIPFTLTLTDGVDSWDSNFSVAVIGTELVYFGHTIADTPYGNNDGDADPGETIIMGVVLENTGAVDATNISAVLTSDQPAWVTILNDAADFDDILMTQTGASLAPDFSFALDYDTPCGLLITFTLNVATSEGSCVTEFPFIVGGMGVGFADDMESGPGSWTHYAGQGTDDWAIITSSYAHSPTHCWRSTDVASVKDDYLITQNVSITINSELAFWHRYNLETGYDGAVIEITTNGTTWTDLGPYITQGQYNDTISSYTSSPIGGRNAWSGDSGTTPTQVVADLSTFAGATDAQIRFRLACDSSVSDDGWYVDDVEIIGAECQPYSQPFFSCNAEALTPVVNPGGQARFRLTVENLTDQSLTRKVVTNIYLCNGNFLKEDLSLGFVPFDPYQIRQATRVLDIPGGVPQGVKNCDLRYELVVIDRDTGAVLCSSSCYFQIQD